MIRHERCVCCCVNCSPFHFCSSWSTFFGLKHTAHVWQCVQQKTIPESEKWKKTSAKKTQKITLHICTILWKSFGTRKKEWTNKKHRYGIYKYQSTFSVGFLVFSLLFGFYQKPKSTKNKKNLNIKCKWNWIFFLHSVYDFKCFFFIVESMRVRTKNGRMMSFFISVNWFFQSVSRFCVLNFVNAFRKRWKIDFYRASNNKKNVKWERLSNAAQNQIFAFLSDGMRLSIAWLYVDMYWNVGRAYFVVCRSSVSPMFYCILMKIYVVSKTTIQCICMCLYYSAYE